MDEEKLRRFAESADMLCVAEYGGDEAYEAFWAKQ